MRNLALAFAFLCLTLVAQGFSPVLASAQDDQPDPFKTARIRFGPLAFSPTVSITDVGLDTNVFNDSSDPKRDFTATLSPGANVWFRFGRARLTAVGNVGFQYFYDYAKERAINTRDSLRLDVFFAHLVPYAAATYISTRERQGFEVDARARRWERGITVGADVLLSRRATFGLSARRTAVAYGADAEFLGTSLREALDGKNDVLTGRVRYKLTPLTTSVLEVDAERRRFDFSPVKNADSVRVLAGLDLDAAALIDGSVRVGYRKLDMLSQTAPNYRGLVASVGLGYTLLGITRFSVQLQRDIQYSFEFAQPYYVLLGGDLTVTQRVGGPFDVQGRLGADRLDYRQLAAGTIAAPGRTDTVRIYGAGLGYHLSQGARVGVNVDWQRRQSLSAGREYHGLRLGTSFTIGS